MKDWVVPVSIGVGSLVFSWAIQKWMFSDANEALALYNGFHVEQEGEGQEEQGGQEVEEGQEADNTVYTFQHIVNVTRNEIITNLDNMTLEQILLDNAWDANDLMVGYFLNSYNEIEPKVIHTEPNHLFYFQADPSLCSFIHIDLENKKHVKFLKECEFEFNCDDSQEFSDTWVVQNPINAPIVEMLHGCLETISESQESYRRKAYCRAIQEVCECPLQITAFDVCNDIYRLSNTEIRPWRVGSKMRERIRQFLASRHTVDVVYERAVRANSTSHN